MNRQRAFMTTTVAFVGLGPVVGNTVWVVGMWLIAASQDEPPQNLDAQITMWGILVSLLVAGIPFAYMLGFIPALITGVLFSVLVVAVPSFTLIRKQWRAAVAAVIGAAVSGLAYVAQDTRGYEGALVRFILAGTVAAFVVGYFWPTSKTLLSNNALQATCEDARA